MKGSQRREKILQRLTQSEIPLSGEVLAGELGVSRQVIVQDIALLRTSHTILAMTRGYMLEKEEKSTPQRVFFVCHEADRIADELYEIVDAGGRVRNVMVEHDVYGRITAELLLTNRREVDAFCERLRNSSSGPLYRISDGPHSHLVEAEEAEILDYIEERLRRKGYLSPPVAEAEEA